jgi:hypothetical protein
VSKKRSSSSFVASCASRACVLPVRLDAGTIRVWLFPTSVGMHERPYVDAPWFAKPSVHDGWKGRLHPYIRTLVAAWPLFLKEFAGWLLNRCLALEALRSFWASPTPVQPVLPSLSDLLSNRWCVLLCRICLVRRSAYAVAVTDFPGGAGEGQVPR